LAEAQHAVGGGTGIAGAGARQFDLENAIGVVHEDDGDDVEILARHRP
jgi:hypothetical protein